MQHRLWNSLQWPIYSVDKTKIILRVGYNCHDRELKTIFILIFVLKVAVNPQTGISRGFAFVDYGTAEEAERGQKAHNGALLEGTNIRVAYGTPGRTGASILGGQNTNVVRSIFKILVSVCGMTNSLRYNVMSRVSPAVKPKSLQLQEATGKEHYYSLGWDVSI